MSHVPKNPEPIPGYLVKQRLGVGGYGEVWSAQAPGGLTKAIKFVYGYFDDARATRELKALDRIKQVRHPFLLSLERFEIVDGQLIIVTELADMSLKERYEQVRQAGADGIFRDELLRYLRDAADALDYMNESFSLQHLDVKPENLLLVGGHVKVADFGLVKDLQHDATASLMGGLTPIYAAPEVFDDRPSQRSDQYSLAIVYQEMLTGNLPFPGRTPAQLASQHLHASPRLAGLSASDQAVIARALSKEPEDRFPGCRAMVDALYGQVASGGWAESGGRPASSDTTPIKSAMTKTDPDGSHRVPQPGDSRTYVRGEEPAPLSESRCAAALARRQAVEPIAEVGPVELENLATDLRPTLFVGIGGTSGRVLRRLRRRLGDRFGTAARLATLPMLVFDTDAKQLYQLTEGDADTALTDREIVALPLRGAHDYSTDNRKILGWLSRRWLYNIPRSLQTEGRRPLGRLALVDHAPQVLERLRTALAEMTSPEALAAASEIAGQNFDGARPRVIVVASISGGTGGGMVLDLVYTLRKLLKDQCGADDGVVALLTHSTDRNTSAAELATANALACLTELQHYREKGYQAGSCGLPTPDSGGDLPNVYFVPLGQELSESQFDLATERLASYLYLSTATPAGAVLDRLRCEVSPEAAEVSVRGFGTASIGSLQTELPMLAAEYLCQEVVDHWRGTAHDRRERGALPPLIQPSKDLPVAAEHAEALHLEFNTLREGVISLLDKEFGGDADAVFARLRAKLDGGGSAPGRTTQLVRAIRELVEPPSTGSDGLKIALPPAHVAIERGLKLLAAPYSEAIRDWILRLADDPCSRVGWTAKCKDWYAGHVKSIDTETAELLKETQQNIQALEQSLLASDAQPVRRSMFGARRTEQKHAAEIEGMLLLLLRLRLQAFTLQGIAKLLRYLNANISAAGDQIKDLQRELGQWSGQFEADLPWADEETPAPTNIVEEIEQALARQLELRMGELARTVDQRIERDFLLPHGGLRHVCQKADALRPAMLAALRAEARAEILNALQGIALSEAVLGSDPEQQAARLEACRELARPTLLDCGGSQRLLALVPKCDGSSQLGAALTEKLSPPPTILTGSDADLGLCYEQQELSLPHVAARLTVGRDDYAEIASRLHTRTDVSWTALPDPNRVSASASAAKVATAAPAAAAPLPESVTMTQPTGSPAAT